MDRDIIVTAYDSHYDCYDSTTGRFPMEFLFESKEKHEDWYVKKRKIQEEEREKERRKVIEQKERKELDKTYSYSPATGG